MMKPKGKTLLREILSPLEGDGYKAGGKMENGELIVDWNDKARTLTIAERQGSYPGMLSSRQFTVILPNGTTKTISYHGHPVTLTL